MERARERSVPRIRLSALQRCKLFPDVPGRIHEVGRLQVCGICTPPYNVSVCDIRLPYFLKGVLASLLLTLSVVKKPM